MTGATFKAPTAGLQIQGISGTIYTADSQKVITGVGNGDITSLLNAGCLMTSNSGSGDGIFTEELRLLEFRNITGASLAAAAASTVLGYAVTLGTSMNLVGEAATGATKADNAMIEYVVPQSYVDGSNLTLTLNANYSGTGTNNASTIGANVYVQSDTGTQGASINATAAKAITGTAADYAFTLTGTTLTPGMKLIIEPILTVIESGGSAALTGHINSARIG